MPWIIGIDEAGYGPNLGPLVMTSVACRVPEDLATANLWHVLRAAVRCSAPADGGRIFIGDSKQVYSTDRGLSDLETGVLAAVSPVRRGAPFCLAEYVDWACPASHAGLRGEAWYTGSCGMPVAADIAQCAGAAERFHEACSKTRVAWGLIRSVVVCPPQFNGVLDEWGSKGAVLATALTDLLRANQDLEAGDSILFVIDKHGGRNTYTAMVQHALEDGMVIAHEEGMNRSIYSVLGVKREIRLIFQPRADGEHFCVALASMCSKYLREVLMLEFNRFWQGHLPALKPTAGYPGDAARFFEEIRPVADRLGISETALWRRK